MTSNPRQQSAALVAANDSNGALAAIRDLGRAGVSVMVPRPTALVPVRFSRYVASHVEAQPAAAAPDERLAWLMRVGRANPGTVLMPAVDELTWLIASNQAELKAHFQLYYPTPDVLYSFLNKQMLHEDAEAAGLAVPAAWFPPDLKDLDQMAPHLTYPVVIKPLAHIGAPSWLKGWLARDAGELRLRYRQALTRLAGGPGDSRDGRWAFVQEYHPNAGRKVYNISGFIDHTGELSGYSATMKVLQQPQRFGVGLCFVAAPLDQNLVLGLDRLLRDAGFFGMFEAEFIEVGGRRLLIDFNPRIFNGLSLPTARGLRLSLTWYLAALGDWAGVDEQLAASRAAGNEVGRPVAWCNRTGLRTMVASRLLTGQMGVRETRRWSKWIRSSRARVLDADWEPDDPWPGRLRGIQHLAGIAIDPRYFVGTFVRD